MPWPVVLDTACGSFAAFPDGQVMRADLRPSLEPNPGYRVPAGNGSWAQVQGGHVVFVKDMHPVWRSAGGGYDPDRIDSAVMGRDWVAFLQYVDDQDFARMWFAPLDGRERVIALNEAPLTATPWGGFLTSRWRGNEGDFDIVARRPDGSLLRVVATKVAYGDPQRDGTVLYKEGSKVMRTDGLHSIEVADTTSLGGPRAVGFTSLPDGRLVLTNADHIQLLGSDGRVEASAAAAPIPKGAWGYLGAQMILEPGTRAIVFTATHYGETSGQSSVGWEGVYRLAPGQGRATLLFARRLTVQVCAHMASLSWHGRWLLYSACEGRVVAIDTSGRHDPIVLNGLARSVPMPESERDYGLYGATWAPIDSPSRLPELARLG